jgi:hypothetical protein
MTDMTRRIAGRQAFSAFDTSAIAMRGLQLRYSF